MNEILFYQKSSLTFNLETNGIKVTLEPPSETKNGIVLRSPIQFIATLNVACYLAITLEPSGQGHWLHNIHTN